jgi:hypothetical protein
MFLLGYLALGLTGLIILNFCVKKIHGCGLITEGDDDPIIIGGMLIGVLIAWPLFLGLAAIFGVIALIGYLGKKLLS